VPAIDVARHAEFDRIVGYVGRECRYFFFILA